MEDTMKALTLRQPWASLIVTGAKDVENRTWPYRMPRDFPHHLAIHAAKADTDNDPTIPKRAWDALSDVIGGAAPPRGVLLGTVLVVGCHNAAEEFVPCSRWADPACWHWTLADPQPLAEPVPYKGRQGLWNVPDDIAA